MLKRIEKFIQKPFGFMKKRFFPTPPEIIFPIDPKLEEDIVEKFHKLYYNAHTVGKTWLDTYWFGIPTQKCPLDLWVYQEILFELRPDMIIETGTANGGSALFLACICDLIGNGNIITIDIEKKERRPQHERITYLIGASTSTEIVEKVKCLIKEKEKILVLLDSDHSKENVLKEMHVYNEFVAVGSYMVVEDTNVNGHPVFEEFGPGPMEAVEEFVKENKNFVIDKSKEKLYLTFNPNGFLQKIAPNG